MVNANCVRFKLDSGADATVVSADQPWLKDIELQSAKFRLVGPSNYPIKCLGSFVAQLRHGEYTCSDTI